MYDEEECTEKSALWADMSDDEKVEFHDLYDRECLSRCCPQLVLAEAEDSRDKKRLGLGLMDCFLPVWIILAMALGLILGNFVPNTHAVLTNATFVGVSLPIAIGLLVMMYPILCKVRYEDMLSMLTRREIIVNIFISVAINWIVAPLLMLGLAWAFLPDQQDLREGLIVVGLGRCIAMVLIWTRLAKGDSDLCAIIVAVNSLLQIVLISPMALLYLNVVSHSGDSHKIEFDIATKSVAVFLGIPLGAAVITRVCVRPFSPDFYDRKLMPSISPLSLLGLLFTIIIMFASQGKAVAENIIAVCRVAAPLITYFVIIFMTTFFIFLRTGHTYETTCTHAFTAASNNFELAIAICAAVFGVDSQQALASTIGPLIEVPVLVAFVLFAKLIKPKLHWADQSAAKPSITV
ncbi:LADA_0E05908g1_1 [Lachancea dasiensis]|uniref:LADA_0E05908g1_1 n=1 Tax=Lachancea dasiensis TaxID=1072105 RepID=A0A1G4JC89_9SACH|nr:LADA_0E05908g1_1 [Lachancea dasiensis]